MTRMTCTLLAHSIGSHLQQIYTGFHLLRRAGLITLRQRVPRRDTLCRADARYRDDLGHAQLRVVLGDGTRLHYDAHDSHRIDPTCLDQADLYFKRSYRRDYVDGLGPARRKVHPLGLNYPVHPDGADWLALRRALALGGRGGLAELLRLLHLARAPTRLRRMQALPDFAAPPRVLFMARAWDPHDDPRRTPEKAAERARLNEARAECVRRLRREFKGRFYGGFAHSDYACRHFRDCLVPDPRLTGKTAYLHLLPLYPIGVATTGLHGSTGWKLGEYVAFAKAIVSERLNHEAPGAFAAPRNYLEFTGADQCAAQVQRLFDDPALRHRLMAANLHYYHNYLRPDALVLNTLLSAVRPWSSFRQPPK